MLEKYRETFSENPARYVLIGREPPLFVWLQRADVPLDWARMVDKASAAALAVLATDIVGLVVTAHAAGEIADARQFDVPVPKARSAENANIYEDAERMSRRAVKLEL